MEVHVPKPMYLQENHSLIGEDASRFLRSIALISFEILYVCFTFGSI